MKLEAFNKLVENSQISHVIYFMEGVFSGKDLSDLSDNDSNLFAGIKKLEDIINGNGDDMSFGDIELAAAAFKKLSELLENSKDGLKEQLHINKLSRPDN